MSVTSTISDAHALYGPTFNPEETLKALSYFDDGNLRDLPDDLKLCLLTLDIARRTIWFEPPDHALADPIRFMTYAMTYARHEDMRVPMRYGRGDRI